MEDQQHPSPEFLAPPSKLGYGGGGLADREPGAVQKMRAAGDAEGLERFVAEWLVYEDDEVDEEAQPELSYVGLDAYEALCDVDPTRGLALGEQVLAVATDLQAPALAEILGRIESPDAAIHLLALLDGLESDWARLHVARQLCQRGEPVALDWLRGAPVSSSSEVAREAITALAKQGGSAAPAAIARGLEHPNERVQREAARALVQLDDQSVLPQVEAWADGRGGFQGWLAGQYAEDLRLGEAGRIAERRRPSFRPGMRRKTIAVSTVLLAIGAGFLVLLGVPGLDMTFGHERAERSLLEKVEGVIRAVVGTAPAFFAVICLGAGLAGRRLVALRGYWWALRSIVAAVALGLVILIANLVGI